MPATIFPNFSPGNPADSDKKAIEALRTAKEYSIIDDEDILQRNSILSKI